MKRSTLIILTTTILFITLIIGGWIFARLTGILNFYRISSSANEPNLVVGQHIFTSNIKDLKRFDFIAYRDQEVTIVHRLCGLPGDTLQIADGLLLVNGKASKVFLMRHNYEISEIELETLKSKGLSTDKYQFLTDENDKNYISLDDDIAKKYGIANKRIIEKKGVRDEYVGEQWRNDYNLDNFGPVIVPEDCYFVLGDNRHYSADSRYIGFIHKSKYVATVLGKF